MGTTSSRFIQKNIDSCARLGVDKNALIELVPGGAAALNNPIKRFDNEVLIAVFKRAEQLSGDIAIGFRAGLNHDNAVYSDMCFTIQYCKNLRESFGVYKRYERFSQQLGANQIIIRGGNLEITWHTEEDAPEKLRHASDVSLSALAHMGMWIKVVHGLPIQSLQVKHNVQCYDDLYKNLFGCPVTYGAQTNTLIIDERFLDVPLPTANPALLKLLLARLERDLAVMEFPARTDYQVAACIEYLLGIEAPTLSQVSLLMDMTERSLRRRLSECGTTYRRILEQVRCERYPLLLLQPGLTQEQIARMLGYSEQSALSRASKKWKTSCDCQTALLAV